MSRTAGRPPRAVPQANIGGVLTRVRLLFEGLGAAPAEVVVFVIEAEVRVEERLATGTGVHARKGLNVRGGARRARSNAPTAHTARSILRSEDLASFTMRGPRWSSLSMALAIWDASRGSPSWWMRCSMTAR